MTNISQSKLALSQGVQDAWSHNDFNRKEERPFGEKVTITGLFEITNAKEQVCTRIFFAISLLFSAVFTTYATVNLVKLATDADRVKHVDIKFMSQGRVPFPNATICVVGLGVEEAFDRIAFIPSDIEKAVKKLGADNDTLMDEMKLLLSYSNGKELKQLNNTLRRYTLSNMQMILDSLPNKLSDLIALLMPACDQILTKCSLNGIEFDCCRNVVLSTFPGGGCYKIMVDNIFTQNSTTSVNMISSLYSGDQHILTIDAKKDWSHELEIPSITEQSDAFILMINEFSLVMAANPVAVAAGWHTLVSIPRPKLRKDRRACIDERMLPKMRVFEYYDSVGVASAIEKVDQMNRHFIGCSIPLNDFFYNVTNVCDTWHFYFYAMCISGSASDNFNSGTNNKFSMATRAAVEQVTKGGNLAVPICRRWEYPSTVSYAETGHQYDDKRTADPNVSLSRITVRMAATEYEIHEEQPPSPIYVLISNIAGVFGVAAGFSMLTLIQLLWYSSAMLIRYQIGKAQTDLPS